MKITISQEGTSPISITVPDNNKPEVKSSEGILAGIGIAIGAFFILGIVSSIIGSTIDNAKFKKAYNELTDEQKRKVKTVLKETIDYMYGVCEDELKPMFEKFKNKILKDKNSIEKLGYKICNDEFKYDVSHRNKPNFDKSINRNMLFGFSSISSIIRTQVKMIDDYNFDTYQNFSDNYIDELDKFMKSHNIDEEPDSNEITKINLKNITNNIILKPVVSYDTTYGHHISENGKIFDIIYEPRFNFTIDKAKSRKEIGFFLDLLNKK